MKIEADYEYEYYAFNEEPVWALVDEQEMWNFNTPVRVFPTGPTGQRYAEQWVREGNSLREEARRASRKGMTIDAIAGKIVNLEVRRRLVIKLGYERVTEQDPQGLVAEAVSDVKENWVPA